MTHVTCRLTAKNWDQLRNPTLSMGYLYLFLVTTCLSCTISLLLPLLQCTWLPVGGLTLKKTFIFAKQLRLKTIDTSPFMYINVVNTCHIHWWTEIRIRFKTDKKVNFQGHSRSLILVPFDRTHMWFAISLYPCNYISILYCFSDISTHFPKF